MLWGNLWRLCGTGGSGRLLTHFKLLGKGCVEAIDHSRCRGQYIRFKIEVLVNDHLFGEKLVLKRIPGNYFCVEGSNLIFLSDFQSSEFVHQVFAIRQRLEEGIFFCRRC